MRKKLAKCLTCAKEFKTSPPHPKCPKCGESDPDYIDLNYENFLQFLMRREEV
jgi:Zn finger protein HypA/HybF involved in hydrogenase expression